MAHRIHEPRWNEYKERNRTTVIYVDRELRGPFPDSARDVKRHCEQYVLEALEKLHLPPTTEFKWSRTAGCRCGCSPGFKLPGYHGRSIGVGYVKPPKQLELWS